MKPDMGDSVEASTLGLRPGIWPRQITYQRRTYAAVGMERDREGELIAVRYEDEQGRRLRVVND
jgi:hypothetical protein